MPQPSIPIYVKRVSNTVITGAVAGGIAGAWVGSVAPCFDGEKPAPARRRQAPATKPRRGATGGGVRYLPARFAGPPAAGSVRPAPWQAALKHGMHAGGGGARSKGLCRMGAHKVGTSPARQLEGCAGVLTVFCGVPSVLGACGRARVSMGVCMRPAGRRGRGRAYVDVGMCARVHCVRATFSTNGDPAQAGAACAVQSPPVCVRSGRTAARKRPQASLARDSKWEPEGLCGPTKCDPRGCVVFWAGWQEHRVLWLFPKKGRRRPRCVVGALCRRPACKATVVRRAGGSGRGARAGVESRGLRGAGEGGFVPGTTDECGRNCKTRRRDAEMICVMRAQRLGGTEPFRAHGPFPGFLWLSGFRVAGRRQPQPAGGRRRHGASAGRCVCVWGGHWLRSAAGPAAPPASGCCSRR